MVLVVASDDLVQALVGVDRLDCSLVLGVLDYFVVDDYCVVADVVDSLVAHNFYLSVSFQSILLVKQKQVTLTCFL